MIEYEERYLVSSERSIKPSEKVVIGIDVGGTNTRCCISVVDTGVTPIAILRFSTKKLDSLIPCVRQAILWVNQNLETGVQAICIGAAGIVCGENVVELTNTALQIDLQEVKEITGIEKIVIKNDFQLIGYGLDLLDWEDQQDIVWLKPINKKESIRRTRAIIGAGTGLGKTIIPASDADECIDVLASEGGHADLPLFGEDEMRIASSIITQREGELPLTYEDVLSGPGLEKMYRLLHATGRFTESEVTQEILDSKDPAELIAKYKDQDATCKEVFSYFTRFYARCAKNFILDTMALGGLFIAGGIIAKNPDIVLNPLFSEELFRSQTRSGLLKDVPIGILMNYDVSLYGACRVASMMV